MVNETGRDLGGKAEATADAAAPAVGGHRRVARIYLVCAQPFSRSVSSGSRRPRQSRQIRCAWKICTLSGDPVTSSSGMVIEPTVPLGEIDEYDYVAVVGGLLAQYRHSQQALIDLIKRADKRGKAVVGLCTAAFLLAEAGVLEDRNCCVSWFHRDDFLSFSTAILPIRQAFSILAGGIIPVLAALALPRWRYRSSRTKFRKNWRAKSHPSCSSPMSWCARNSRP